MSDLSVRLPNFKDRLAKLSPENHVGRSAMSPPCVEEGFKFRQVVFHFVAETIPVDPLRQANKALHGTAINASLAIYH